MRDADENDGEADGDMEGDADDDGEANSPSNSSQASDGENGSGERDTQANPALHEDGSSSQQHAEDPFVTPTKPSIRLEILNASTYDIVPTIAAPQSTSINAITSTGDMRWVFTGGSDGYIRKYNWVETVNSKLMLTVAQRHPFVDSVVKAGVLMTYWENWDVPGRNTTSQPSEETATLCPVYSLAVQNQALWLLAGTDSGSIRLQSVRHDEGKEIALFQRHTSAVSVLSLSSDERSLLSGSWDKNVLDWDLNVGQVRTTFGSSAGQISSIEPRPVSSVPVPQESGEEPITNGTFSSNNHVNGGGSSAMANGIGSRDGSQPPQDEAPPAASPDSLFGGDDDDLFGDDGGAVISNGAPLNDTFGEDDDELTHATGNGPVAEGGQDIAMTDAAEGLQPVQAPVDSVTEPEMVRDGPIANGVANEPATPVMNGIPHAEDLEMSLENQKQSTTPEAGPTSDSTFLATTIDGTIRVWDRRQPNPTARILPRNTPPWCMSACWSPDGNYIYAGRRNCTVEEFDLRKGLRSPERTFRFPQGSGAVTSVKAMPNGRHLICASHDILRLYDLKEPQSTRSTVPFLIVPGHRTGVISHLYFDPACRFMISTGGNRGWEGASTEVLLGYEVGVGT
jgi:transcriptional activator SPT8